MNETDLELTDTETLETDGTISETAADPEVSASPEYEAMTIQDYNHLAISSVPIGFLSGAIFMIIGLTVHGIVMIFKKV